MDTEEIKANVKTIRGHLQAAKDRNAPLWFITGLRDRMQEEIEKMHPMTSKARNLITASLVCLMLAVGGCRTVASVGDLVSSAGQDLRSIAESSESAVKGYGNGL